MLCARVQEEAMKILRSVNRRGFRIGSAGYFTVLWPNTWFPASRLSDEDDFHYLTEQSEEIEFPRADENPAENPTSALSPESIAFLSQYMDLSAHDQRLVRTGLIVLASTAITFIILWWLLSYGNFPDIVPGNC
jgi:hypothetical protein